MTAAPVPAVPHHTSGAVTGAHQPFPGGAHRRQRVRVPWRIIASPWYPDACLSVYMKVAALAQRGADGCTAAVERIAEFLGWSKSAVERALRFLTREDREGVTEITTRRRTKRGGTGQTAQRHVRPLNAGERYVWLPVAAADSLPPHLLRAYAALTYAVARRLPVTEAELGDVLGKGERSGSRAIDALAARAWITVHRRAGDRGRHLVDVHDHPLQPVPTPDTYDGSGPDTSAGSLASKEDGGELTDGEKAQDSSPSAVGEVQESAREPVVDNPPPATFRPAAAAAPSSAEGGSPYGGPELQLSPRVWQVLAPVRHLLPGIRTFLLRKAAREIGRQLDDYATVERLRARIEWRYAQRDHFTDPMRDPGAWLLAAGLPHWGCGQPDCESGTRWSTGQRCAVCAELAADRRRADAPPRDTPDGPPHRPVRPHAPPWHVCRSCERPSRSRAHTDGLCADCRPPTATDTTARRYPA